MKNQLKVGLLLLGLSTNVLSYDILERYKILEDKFKTEEMLRAPGHDFYLDISAYANKNLFEVIDEAKKVSEETNSSAQIQAANDFLVKYKDTEQTGRVNIQAGVPLPSFTSFGVRFVPDIHFGAQFGANVAIRTEDLTPELMATLVDFPPEIEQLIIDMPQSVFNDLTAGNYADMEAFLLALGVDAAIANQYSGEPLPASGVTNVPNLGLFTKLDITAGVKFNYFKKAWFGYWNLYLMNRTDFFQRYDEVSLANNDKLVDVEEAKQQLFLMTDFKVGRKFFDVMSAQLILEDIKISRISENEATAGALLYEIEALIRTHVEAKLAWSGFSFVPFGGFHKRSSYGFNDGIYGGVDLGAHVWNDKLGILLRTMLDNEHLTLSPQLKLGFLQLQYSLKQPVKKQKDDFEVSTMHSLNFRLFF